ncbi:MAG: hypothetical protein AAF585_13970 [Verrucomicrobiota bacterium]
MTATESITSIAEIASTLKPAELLQAIERSMELSNPGLAELYERVADLEAADVARSIDEGEEELHDIEKVLTSLRSQYAG